MASERFMLPETGEVVRLVYPNGDSQEVRFQGLNESNDKQVRVTFLGKPEVNSNIALEAFVNLAHLFDEEQQG